MVSCFRSIGQRQILVAIELRTFIMATQSTLFKIGLNGVEKYVYQTNVRPTSSNCFLPGGVNDSSVFQDARDYAENGLATEGNDCAYWYSARVVGKPLI